MELVLFLMLYKRLRLPKAPRSTQTLLTQRASHLHRRRSVPFSTTHSTRNIRYDSFGVQTVAGAGWMFRERAGEVESVPSALSRGCTRGARHVLWRDHAFGGTEAAGRRCRRHPKNNGMPQLSTALSQFTSATLVGQPVLLLPSVMDRARLQMVASGTEPPPPTL
ncbi:hypothetical protein VZT92_012687 [Zoarces viviparus]|uniref:Uncharacterized protein n=1 Tax=Zoarces viviparus TaxID=48416 RepID=A0AAW1F4E6_ZOAVI